MSHPRDGEAWKHLGPGVSKNYRNRKGIGQRRCCLVELSLFYQDLCVPKISASHMRELEESIPILMCKLECIFPPSFFDVMEHLMIYLPYEARVCSPIQFEGSICNAYLIEEAAIFFSYYIKESVPTIHKSDRQNDDIEDPLHVGEVLSICN
ncbi:hypothetical protein M9H77_29841 [Catharanthus roseus]|uniref:Uncharacterized protein n=1 Tax=Catharanthus roseus TaxID=4058 RepID=A0ACB9ZWC1_CATRO|nr:hypothetical protein M9H77_29841 [Catharanthus roseus]